MLQVRYAVANKLITEAEGQAMIDQIADGYAELLAYAALASAGIKAQQPDYDLKAILRQERVILQNWLMVVQGMMVLV